MAAPPPPPSHLIPDSWQEWLATNLLLGADPTTLAEIIAKDLALPREQVDRAVAEAEDHPFLKAAAHLGRQLQKRDWLLQMLWEHHALSPETLQVERRTTPPYETFVEEYYARHRPVILTGGIEHWPARELWTPEHFQTHWRHLDVEVQLDRDSSPLYEEQSHRHRHVMNFGDYTDEVLRRSPTNDLYMTANNAARSATLLAQLFRDLDNFGDGYLDMSQLASGAFLWFGPAGTVTPLHHDLTNNLLVQLHGRKRIRLLPAIQVPILSNDRHVYSPIDPAHPDLDRFPRFAEAHLETIELHPGETLFLPLGTWHHIEALDVSISASFTCFRRLPNHWGDRYPRASG